MTNEIITTLHPDQDPDTNLYPNIKKENIPDRSIDFNKIDIKGIKSENLSNNSISYNTFNKGFYKQINDYNYLVRSTILENLSLDYKLPFDVYFDGKKYITSFNSKNFLNSGYTTCYISPDGDDNNSGLTRDLPVKTLSKAYDVASNNWSTEGGTIVFLEGIYDVDNYDLGSVINRSFNFIGENDNCRLICGKNPNWILDHNNIYKTSNSVEIKDVADIVSDKYSGIRLLKVNSLEQCENNYFSYYYDIASSYIYINIKDNPNNRIVLIYNTNLSMFFLTNNRSNNVVKPYFNKLKFYGSGKNSDYEYSACIWFGLSDDSKPMIPIFDECSFSLGGGGGIISRSSGEIYLHKCIAINNDGDGFQYFGTCKYVEIDCIGCSNGNITIKSTHTENGSTSHNWCKGYRINCIYYNNNGGNVADNGEGIQSVLLGCVSYNSSSDYDWYNQGFGLQTSSPNSYMYLFDCTSYGNYYDIEQTGNAHVIINNDTYYETLEGVLENI